MSFLEILLIVAGSAVALAYVVGITKAIVDTRLNHRLSVNSTLDACESVDVPPDVGRLADEIVALGFRVRGYWKHCGHSHSTGHIALLEHPKTLDVAKVFVVLAGDFREVTVGFGSRFADGSEIVSVNNPMKSAFPGLPHRTTLWLPKVRDPRLLYRTHELLRNALSLDKRRLSVGQDALAYLTEEQKRVRAHMVETGYYSLDESCGVYRFTWKAAVLATAKHSLPFSPIYEAWHRRASLNLLRRLGIHVEPDFGREKE
jgi:hypothetical protein